MSDCTARFSSGRWFEHDDLSLDSFVGGVKIPGGVKTGTQQTATSAKDTLETWMTGYSRYAATAVWVGNSNKQPVRDGPEANYASANATVRLFKNWMGAYHASLKSVGVFDVPAGFEAVQPENVRLAPFQSASTERGQFGGCYGKVNGWQRIDIDYLGGDCQGKACFALPTFKRDLAVTLARSRGIQACGISVAPLNPTPNASPSPEGTANTTAPSSATSPPKKPGTATPAAATARVTVPPSGTPDAPKTPEDD